MGAIRKGRGRLICVMDYLEKKKEKKVKKF
jgi:hypothetical protein